MKGTILDFLTLASKNEKLAQDLVDLAARYGFEFTDEIEDGDLEAVAGGITLEATPVEPTNESLAPTTLETWQAINSRFTMLDPRLSSEDR